MTATEHPESVALRHPGATHGEDAASCLACDNEGGEG